MEEEAHSRVEEIADKVTKNNILTAIARVSIAGAALVGVPVGAWIVTTTGAHSLSIAQLQGDLSRQTDRIFRLEQDDQRDRERAARDLERLGSIDRLLGQIEERTRNMIRDMDALRRRTSLDEAPVTR